jgi:hypothetical protein
MDPVINQCLMTEKELTELIHSIGKTMDGHNGGTCALALCHCLAVVIHQAGVPLELVTETLKKYVQIGEQDETAH